MSFSKGFNMFYLLINPILIKIIKSYINLNKFNLIYNLRFSIIY